MTFEDAADLIPSKHTPHSAKKCPRYNGVLGTQLGACGLTRDGRPRAASPGMIACASLLRLWSMLRGATYVRRPECMLEDLGLPRAGSACASDWAGWYLLIMRVVLLVD